MISIIIPSHNAEVTIANCLNSIVYQDYENFEVIILDGNSVDNTAKVVQSFVVSNSNIRFISEKDDGIYDAMNKGISCAKGEWIYFLGSDDRLVNNSVLSKVAEQFSHNLDLIYGNVIWVPEDYMDKGEKNLSQLLQFGINHQRIFYRKALFEIYGSYNIKYKIAADFDLNIRFFCNKLIRKKYIDFEFAYYHSGGISSFTFDNNLWSEWRTVIYKQFYPYLSKKEIFTKLRGYSWLVMEEKKYKEALKLFFLIYFHTFSYSYVRQSMSQMFKLLKNNK